MIKVNTRPVRICIPALVMGLIIGLTSVELNAEILLRHTIEDYQGTLEEFGWLTNSVDEGEVERFRESDDPLQTQAHGAKSLRISDPDASSYAHAVKTFALPAGEEYMIEFYLWIPGGQVRVAGLNICKLFTAGGNPADIWLTLWQEDDTLFGVWGEDANGIYHVRTINAGRWHKFQIHKRYGSELNWADLYIDGDFIATYTSLSGTTPSGKIFIGTESTALETTGEAFWDDFIITTDYIDKDLTN